MDDSARWFLLKQADGNVFGPMPFSHLQQWAADAYISPFDKVSNDETNWVKAPMIAALEMDYLLEIEPGAYYGPTTIGAIREFLASGEIAQDAVLTNCKTGEQKTLSEFPALFQAPAEGAAACVSAREHLQGRIRELEEALLQERALRKTAEDLRAKAEARVAALEDLLKLE